ncbi:UDP-glycosyltransferase 91A1-like [Ziziphus jujuba]|uniref:UDP-glycosyltransferase 91A1-like n=1 Tax=Ziziphus jujuba TaxID=326968 RepID=A0A6P4A5B3_ZIZJJ|nr:UDP-glycosyltransferase 91A1-like [Ziziphus jujuba]
MSTATANEEAKLHIAMFPWLAFGHMNPFLELAKLIAQKGHRISFISTPRNIDRLPKLAPNLFSLINFVKISLPRSDNLPEEAQATIDLPREQVPHLKNAHDRLQDSMAQFLESLKPDWVVYDFSAHWLPNIARSLGIPSVFFSIFTASCLTFTGPTLTDDDRNKPEDYIVPPYWVPFPSKIAYRLFEVLKIYDGLTGDDGSISVYRSFVEVLRGCDVVVVRTCSEFEPEWLNLLQDVHRKPVFPVGVLAPKVTDDNNEDNNEEWRSIKEWLDLQPKRSVVYIAFGTEAKLGQDELTEIAHGLELSGLPFFWVLRLHHDPMDSELKLPEGFEERSKGRGIVRTTWAPQLKILAHDSVGGFLSHSGWSSVVEALQFSTPLVLFTIANDQGLNCSLFVEKKIGYAIPRDEQDGSFTRQGVADSLRLVVVEEEGKCYRDKAKEMSELFGDKVRQENYVDKFVDHLITTRPPKEAEDYGKKVDENV